MVGNAFPLILTFSRREKEQPLADFLKFASRQAVAAFISAKEERHDHVKSWERFSLSQREREKTKQLHVSLNRPSSLDRPHHPC